MGAKQNIHIRFWCWGQFEELEMLYIPWSCLPVDLSETTFEKSI